MPKCRSDMPGASLGFPMYHALTGNLPVMHTSKTLHRPLKGSAESGPSDYAMMTGNLPIISREFARASHDDLMPGWVQLIDPITKKSFWWNTFYRSRREMRPAPTDDGRRGAGRGELDAEKAAKRLQKLREWLEKKTWEERWDAVARRHYYWHRKANTTQWERPAGFWEDGIAYHPVWVPHEAVEDDSDDEAPAGAAGAAAAPSPAAPRIVYVNSVTHVVSPVRPADYDGQPIDLTWQQEESGGWRNFITGVTLAEKPEGLDAAAAAFAGSLPPAVGAPPSPPADSHLLSGNSREDEEDLALWYDGEDEDGVGGSDEPDDRIMYPPYRGTLTKRGGGYSLIGRRRWQSRFFTARDGFLAYYRSEADADAGKEPLKGVRIPLKNYGVASMPTHPTRFALVPLQDTFSAYTVAGGKGVPQPDRVYEFEATTAVSKAAWIAVLRGRRVDGREIEDVDECAVGAGGKRNPAATPSRKSSGSEEGARRRTTGVSGVVPLSPAAAASLRALPVSPGGASSARSSALSVSVGALGAAPPPPPPPPASPPPPPSS